MVTRHSRSDREDGWSWTVSLDGRYSVKSAYSQLLNGLPGLGAPEGAILQAVSRVWKSCTPSKVVVFSWQLILDRIPTRSNLVSRGVALPDARGLDVYFVVLRLSRRCTYSFRVPQSFLCGIRCLGGWGGSSLSP